MNSVLERTGRDGNGYRAGSMNFQGTGTFVGRGPGGHHIVDQQQALLAEVAPAFESAAHIAQALLVRQIGLGGRGARAHKRLKVDREAEQCAERLGDFACLIEAALAQAINVQREGNYPVASMVCEADLHLCREPLGECQLMPVFQGVNDAVERKVVAECRDGPVEMRRVFQAGTAAFPMGGPVGTDGAGPGRRQRKVGSARRANRFVGAVGAAKQATARQEPGGYAAAGCLDKRRVG